MLFHFHLPLKNRMVTCVKTCVKTKLGLGRRRSNGSREEFDYRKHLQKRDSKHKHKYPYCAFSLAILLLKGREVEKRVTEHSFWKII